MAPRGDQQAVGLRVLASAIISSLGFLIAKDKNPLVSWRIGEGREVILYKERRNLIKSKG